MAVRVLVFMTVWLFSMNAVPAEDRLAVLEFFGRPNGAYCAAAGPAMISLQDEYAGRAVLLEYDYDRYRLGRLDRFRATGANAPYLPLVMVGSGYRVSSGSVSYEQEYRSMIEDEVARAPRASITAFWRRSGVIMRAYLRIHNTGHNPLRGSEDAAAWLIAYEHASTGVSSTWVQSAVHWPIEHDLAPGDHTTALIEAALLESVQWQNMDAIVLVENRPGGTGRFDMLQAAEVLPADVFASPATLDIRPSRPAGELHLNGPHVLQWTATTDVPWLEVTPTSGTLPTTATVVLHDDLRPRMATAGTVSINAEGDSMAFQVQVPVTVGTPREPIGRADTVSLPGKPISPSVAAPCARR